MNRRNTILITIFTIIMIVATAIFFLYKEFYAELGTSDSPLSFATIERLAQKGDQLSYQDFKQYQGKDVGSGLVIDQYYVESGYSLLVGYTSRNAKPMYVKLVKESESKEFESIDIRYENVREFIEKTQ